MKKDTEDSKSDLALNETKVLQLQKDYNGIVNESELVGNVLDKAKAGSSETAAAIAATGAGLVTTGSTAFGTTGFGIAVAGALTGFISATAGVGANAFTSAAAIVAVG